MGGRPKTDWIRFLGMGILGSGLRDTQPEEAIRVLEASLVLNQRYWPDDKEIILINQSNVACCLTTLERHDEALVLEREMYAKKVATLGVSDGSTIQSGLNLSHSMNTLGLWHESRSLIRDQLLPAARQSLGADHDCTLSLDQNLAATFQDNPERTR